MDETIGVKGGYQDRRRVMRLQQLEKERLEELEEESIKQLEKEVKRKERFSLIKTIPLILAGNIFQALVRNKEKKNKDTSWEEVKEEEKPVVEEEKTIVVLVTMGDGKKVKVPVKVENPLVSVPENVTVLPEVPERVEDHQIVVEEGFVRDKEFGIIPVETQEKIESLKAKRIIDTYEDELKGIRFDLRRIIYDYNLLVEEGNDLHKSEEAEALLKELSEIIRKVEELKRRMQVDDYQKYDDNYIYSLIEGYLNDFKEGKAISSIKNSPMYAAISDKLAELDHKKDSFQKKVEEKKEAFQEREEKYSKLKEKTTKFEHLSKEFKDVQTQQEQLLREVQEKVQNAVSVSEKIRIEAEFANISGRRLLGMMGLTMMIPGVRAAKQAAFSTAAYLYFLNQILHPKMVEKKYKVVQVEDYRIEIESSIQEMEKTAKYLSKTSDEIQKTIKTIKSDFKDYIGVYPECDELIRTLEKLEDDIHEREYEIKKIKEAQEKELEKNEAKVLTKGEYPM